MLWILVELHVASISDFLRPRDGIFESGKRFVHFLRSPDEELVRLHLHPIFVGPQRQRTDAKQNVLSVGIFFVEVVSVVCRDQRQAFFVGHVHGHIHAVFLNLNTGVLNLHVEAIAKNLRVPLGQLFSFVHPVLQHQLRQFPRRAARQADDPLVALFKKLLVDTRLVVEAFEVRF